MDRGSSSQRLVLESAELPDLLKGYAALALKEDRHCFTLAHEGLRAAPPESGRATLSIVGIHKAIVQR